MANHALTPELCSRIVQWASHRDLPSLCLTSKAFVLSAQTRIYTTLHLSSATLAYQVCRILINSPHHLATHVRHFIVYHGQRTVLPEAFWVAITSALQKMYSLETLVIADPAEGGENKSWVLEGVRSEGIKEVKVKLGWDKIVRGFIERQPRLKFFHCMDRPDELFHHVLGSTATPSSGTPGTLGSLQMLDAAMVVAADLIETSLSPITHLQVHIDMEFGMHLLEFIPRLVKIKDTLRSLSVIDIPEEVVGKALKLIATFCPGVKHLGIVPLPCLNRHKLHRTLLTLPLHTLELSINSRTWGAPNHLPHLPQLTTSTATALSLPLPSQSHHHPRLLVSDPPFQRILVAECKTFSTGLRNVIFWVGQNRFVWRLCAINGGVGIGGDDDVDGEMWKLVGRAGDEITWLGL